MVIYGVNWESAGALSRLRDNEGDLDVLTDSLAVSLADFRRHYSDGLYRTSSDAAAFFHAAGAVSADVRDEFRRMGLAAHATAGPFSQRRDSSVPCLAAIVISLISLENVLPFLASTAPFLRLIVDHFE